MGYSGMQRQSRIHAVECVAKPSFGAPPAELRPKTCIMTKTRVIQKRRRHAQQYELIASNNHVNELEMGSGLEVDSKSEARRWATHAIVG